MLVLSRKPGERILIGDDIMVLVVRLGPNNVRLGIEAPKSVTIRREELEVTPSRVVEINTTEQKEPENAVSGH